MREPFDLSQEQIDSLAQRVHSYQSDEYDLKWGKQTSKYRNSCRRQMRDVLRALEFYGFKLERPDTTRPTGGSDHGE